MKNITENKNIVIVVKTQFEAEFSRADVPSFIFSYKIHIIKRKWLISGWIRPLIKLIGKNYSKFPEAKTLINILAVNYHTSL